MFVKYCEVVSKVTNTIGKDKSTGWGRLMRACIANWYAEKSPEQLAMHLTKYEKRDGWSHRDLFRLAHPQAKKNVHYEQRRLEIEQLYNYAVNGKLATRKLKLNGEELEQAKKMYTQAQLENELKSKALNFVEVYLYLNDYSSENDVSYAIRNYSKFFSKQECIILFRISEGARANHSFELFHCLESSAL